MKQCPQCRKTYDDAAILCQYDGSPLLQAPPDISQAETQRIESELVDDSVEKGILDYSLDIEEAFEQVNGIMVNYSEEITKFNDKSVGNVARMEHFNANPAAGTAKQRHAVALQIASDMNLFSKSIECNLQKFDKNVNILDVSLSGLMSIARITSEDDKKRIASARRLLVETLDKIIMHSESFYTLREVVQGLNRISREITRASRRLDQALAQFISNVKKVELFAQRTIDLIDEKFED
jgi:hypothetical protein